jgi:hypothetical protein
MAADDTGYSSWPVLHVATEVLLTMLGVSSGDATVLSA